MPTGSAIITTLKDLEPIEGADRIVQSKIYGETVIVSKDHEEGELGILFDIETELSHDFCYFNNLYRHSHLNENKTKSGYIEDNRRVKPIRLKGVQCSGFWMPIKSLEFTKSDFWELKEGTQLTEINDFKICEKYVPKSNQTQGSGKKQKEGRTSMRDLVPTFKEHFDTDHWARNKHKVTDGDVVIITEKLHGTSFRCGRLITKEAYVWWEYIIYFLYQVFAKRLPKFKKRFHNGIYKFVVGSRRTVKSIDGNEREEAKHYYDADLWTEICSSHFKGKLNKGETIYGEIVGYTPQASPIMGTHSNSKLKKFMSSKEYKKFIKDYGEETRFTYGTDRMSNNNLNKVYVYRITRTNDDGETIDLSWAQVKQRCEVLGVPHVPELKTYLVEDPTDHKIIDQEVDVFTNLPSDNFPNHIKEGVCIRVENGRLVPMTLKNKAYLFRVLEGQITEPTMEDDN